MYKIVRNKWALTRKGTIMHWVLRKFLHIFYGNTFQEDMININIKFYNLGHK